MGRSNERETLTDAERFEKAMQAILAVPPEKAEAIPGCTTAADRAPADASQA